MKDLKNLLIDLVALVQISAIDKLKAIENTQTKIESLMECRG